MKSPDKIKVGLLLLVVPEESCYGIIFGCICFIVHMPSLEWQNGPQSNFDTRWRGGMAWTLPIENEHHLWNNLAAISGNPCFYKIMVCLVWILSNFDSFFHLSVSYCSGYYYSHYKVNANRDKCSIKMAFISGGLI